jgi:hypothetical protein
MRMIYVRVKGPSEKGEEREPRLTLNYKTGRL